MTKFHSICKTTEVPVGTAKSFWFEDLAIGIFNVNNEYYALNNHCPHAGASLADGLIDQNTVRCRIHHWKFNIQTGVCVDASMESQSTACYPVRIVGDQIQVEF